jgi:hypothetical protein
VATTCIGQPNYPGTLRKHLTSKLLSVAVCVMHIRHMRVGVSHWPVLVRMCVGFAGRIRGPMGMPVVDIVHVRVRMHEGFMKMLVLVTLRQM